jgi:dethiobiotin synthetase
MTAALLLAGTHAGVGKTTVAAGLASALRCGQILLLQSPPLQHPSKGCSD